MYNLHTIDFHIENQDGEFKIFILENQVKIIQKNNQNIYDYISYLKDFHPENQYIC